MTDAEKAAYAAGWRAGAAAMREEARAALEGDGRDVAADRVGSLCPPFVRYPATDAAAGSGGDE